MTRPDWALLAGIAIGFLLCYAVGLVRERMRPRRRTVIDAREIL